MFGDASVKREIIKSQINMNGNICKMVLKICHGHIVFDANGFCLLDRFINDMEATIGNNDGYKFMV